MRCALVQNLNNTVINLIVADPSTDPAHEGTTIIGLPDDSPVSFNWIYDPVTRQFTDPNPLQNTEVTP